MRELYVIEIDGTPELIYWNMEAALEGWVQQREIYNAELVVYVPKLMPKKIDPEVRF